MPSQVTIFVDSANLANYSGVNPKSEELKRKNVTLYALEIKKDKETLPKEFRSLILKI